MARRGINAAIFGLALLIVVTVIQEHELKSNTAGGAVIVAICLGMTYRGILVNFSSARGWAGFLAFACILAWLSGVYDLLSGKISLAKYEIFSAAVGIPAIACFVFVFLQLHRLARIRHERRWAPLKWLLACLPRWRRPVEPPAFPARSIMPSGGQDQSALD